MSGLLVKDFRLMMQRKRFFLFLLVMAVFMGFSMWENMSMIVGYLTMISVLFCVSTMSYDEYDNCYAFLMTLPVDRRSYVREKYVFGFLIGLGAWGVSIVICCVGRAAQVQNLPERAELMETLIFIVLGYLMLDLIIPLQLKYGMERGRMIMVMTMGVAVLSVYLGDNLAKSKGIDLEWILDNTVTGVDVGIGITGMLAVVLLLTGLSVLASQRIMERRDF